jgi:hypothetical protein
MWIMYKNLSWYVSACNNLSYWIYSCMNVYSILLTRHLILFIVYIFVIVNLVLIYFTSFKLCCVVCCFIACFMSDCLQTELLDLRNMSVCMYWLSTWSFTWHFHQTEEVVLRWNLPTCLYSYKHSFSMCLLLPCSVSFQMLLIRLSIRT